MRRDRVSFQSGDLALEGVLVVPEGASSCPAVVVCHPHPLYGGDMDNHVVIRVCYQLEARGIASLRFNFRGAGESTGRHAQGIGEQDDLRAAISFMETVEEITKDRMGVAGYSFGAGVAARVAADDDRVKALATISLPTRSVDLTPLQGCAKPKLFIAGSRDDFVSAEDLQGLVASLPEPRRCVIVPGADHFWYYEVDDAAREVADFLASTL